MKLYSLIYLISSYSCFKMTKKVIKICHKKGKWHCLLILSSLTSHLSSLNSYFGKGLGLPRGRGSCMPRLQASSSSPPKIRRWFIWVELSFITGIFISLQNSWLARCSVRWTQTRKKMFGYSWWSSRRFCWRVWLSRSSRKSGILFWITLSDAHLTAKFVKLFAFILSQPVRVPIHLLSASFSLRG